MLILHLHNRISQWKNETLHIPLEHSFSSYRNAHHTSLESRFYTSKFSSQCRFLLIQICLLILSFHIRLVSEVLFSSRNVFKQKFCMHFFLSHNILHIKPIWNLLIFISTVFYEVYR
jgi:magnesium-transporting ATPase (P-type)